MEEAIFEDFPDSFAFLVGSTNWDFFTVIGAIFLDFVASTGTGTELRVPLGSKTAALLVLSSWFFLGVGVASTVDPDACKFFFSAPLTANTLVGVTMSLYLDGVRAYLAGRRSMESQSIFSFTKYSYFRFLASLVSFSVLSGFFWAFSFFSLKLGTPGRSSAFYSITLICCLVFSTALSTVLDCA